MKKCTATAVLFLGLCAIPSLAQADALSDVNGAVNAIRSGDYDQALTLLNNAIGSGNLSADQTATAFFDRGTVFLNKGRLDAAISDFTQTIEMHPKDGKALFMRGNAYLAKGQADAGIADYNASIVVDPKNPDVHANLGNAYRAKGMNDQALAQYGTALTINASPYAYEGRALIYLATNKVELAIADLNEAIKLKPDYTAALTNRGNAYAAQGKNDLAIADFDTELKYKPNDSIAIANRAAILAKMGKTDEAKTALAAVAQANPDSPAPYRTLGDAYMGQKVYAKAIEQYNIALSK